MGLSTGDGAARARGGPEGKPRLRAGDLSDRRLSADRPPARHLPAAGHGGAEA